MRKIIEELNRIITSGLDGNAGEILLYLVFNNITKIGVGELAKGMRRKQTELAPSIRCLQREGMVRKSDLGVVELLDSNCLLLIHQLELATATPAPLVEPVLGATEPSKTPSAELTSSGKARKKTA